MPFTTLSLPHRGWSLNNVTPSHFYLVQMSTPNNHYSLPPLRWHYRGERTEGVTFSRYSYFLCPSTIWDILPPLYYLSMNSKYSHDQRLQKRDKKRMVKTVENYSDLHISIHPKIQFLGCSKRPFIDWDSCKCNLCAIPSNF